MKTSHRHIFNRRRFLSSALGAGAAYGLGAVPGLVGQAQAAGFPAVNQRIVVNLFLSGAPDMRHLFPPAFDPLEGSYGFEHWRHRARAHAIGASAAHYEGRWRNDYLPASANGHEFGILGRCKWLETMWDDNNVALVCNAVGATSRDHDHAILAAERGDVDALPFQRGSGWGGRLAHFAGGNCVSLTATPRTFCLGPAADAPTDLLQFDENFAIPAADMRKLMLYRNPQGNTLRGPKASATRALHAYYQAKLEEISPESAYFRLVEHYRKLREFGDAIEDRLASVGVPEPLAGLVNGSAGVSSTYFGRQIRNLHDAIACHDILNLRAASIEYNAWDSHSNQKQLIEGKLQDLFGAGKALDTLYQVLPPDAKQNLVFVINGEFGRQLKDNGDNGTDHGRGTTMIILGHGVNGGVYGDMFPDAELSRLGDRTPDIEGLTSIDHVFGAACEWAAPGSKDVVFPRHRHRPIESGVDPNSLFA